MALKDHSGSYISNPLAGAITYEYDFYSGSQICIYIGDVLIDNAVSMRVNAIQERTPVYGYANQYYTFAADGKVLISGDFAIAFKEAGYLFWPMKRYIERRLAGRWTSPRYKTDENGKIIRGYDITQREGTFTTAAAQAEKARTMRANVEQMVDWSFQTPQQDNKSFNNFWKELGALPDDRFEDWAEVFEDAIWYGSDPANALLRDRLFSNNIPDDTIPDNEMILGHRRADQYPPIDITITYGDTNNQVANHTVKKLLDVSFVGQSQTIEVSGEPILEVYQYIARNFV